ncbi:hypothetical protein Tco_1547305 [Tanacetum coccineum]
MDRLPANAIGIYFEFLWFSGIRVPFSTFLLSVFQYFKVHISQLVPLGLNKVVSFEVVCRDLNIVPIVILFCEFQCLYKQGDWFSFSKHRKAIPNHLTWRHSCLCVSDDLPSDSYDRNDVQRLCARLIYLREMREEVLVHSRLSSIWFNEECDPVFQRVDDNAERVPSHTTTPTTEGAIIPLPTPDEIAASLPDSRVVKKLKDQAKGTDEANLADLCAEIEDSLERDEGVSMRAILAPTPHLGKRLGYPPCIAVMSASEPSHVGTSAHASNSGHSLSLGGVVASDRVGKSGADVMRRQMDPLDYLACSALARDAEYDQILDDDFGTATRGEEIDLTLFPLASGPYHMPYPYEGVSSPLYTREEWDGPYTPEHSILCKDIFKDPNVCKKALDRTITPAELRRTESLLPLELLNRVNVLSALLVSHVYDLSEELTQTNAKFSEQALTVRDTQNEIILENSKSQGYKDAMDGGCISWSKNVKGVEKGFTVWGSTNL